LAVKLPICSFDAKTRILCPQCEARLKRGELSEEDVRVSMELARLDERELPSFTLQRALRIDRQGIVLEVGPGDFQALRKDPQLLGQLSQLLGAKVWIVEAEGGERKFLEELFYPLRLLAVSLVYLPDGSKMSKAILAARPTERARAQAEEVKLIARRVRGIELLVEFQQEPLPYAPRRRAFARPGREEG
jgi:transcription antitermination factor NusA-like protein